MDTFFIIFISVLAGTLAFTTYSFLTASSKNHRLYPETPGNEKIFNHVMMLLDHPEDWEITPNTLDHKSGISIWLSNRPYADMSLYEPLKVEFGYKKSEIMRSVIDLHRSKWMLEKLEEAIRPEPTRKSRK